MVSTSTAVETQASLQQIHSLDRDEVYGALRTSPRGLRSAEAEARFAHSGANRLPPAPRQPLVSRFLAQFTDLFAVVLLVAAAITFLAYGLQEPHDVGNLELGVGILGIVLLNAIIGFFQEYSAERTAEALEAMVPRTSRVIRGGELSEIGVESLVPGDIVVLEAGDAVSADCRLVEAHELSVNLVALTGESDPVGRTEEASTPERGGLESRNLVFMGTSVVNGTGKAVVYATGADTEFGRIFRLTAGVKVQKSPLQVEVATMAKRVSSVAIIVGAILFALRSVTGEKLVPSFVFALGVMVALVPEGLPAALSVSLAIGVRRMARRNALIEKLVAVETLGSTTVICTDKTGTLTKAEMTVQVLWASGRAHAVSGVGYQPSGEIAHADGVRDLLRTAALCSDARILPPDPAHQLEWRTLGDTTEGALIVAAAKAGVDVDAEAQKTPRVAEFPFDAARKLMSTIHRVDGHYWSYLKGSPQELLSRCTRVEHEGVTCPMTDEERAGIAEANDRLAGEGLRVLGVARREVSADRPPQDEAEQDLAFLGLVGMLDPPRPEVASSVAQCRAAGIRIIMVTGDYGLTAAAIASRVGIVAGREHPRIISGRELEAMSDSDLGVTLASDQGIVFARVKP